MRVDFLDHHRRFDSPLHRLAAGPKLATALGIIVLITVTPLTAAWFYGVVAAGLVGAIRVARLPWRYVGKRLLWIEPVLLGMAALAWWQPEGGLVFASILVKSTLSVLTMLVLANTTSFPELLDVLRRAHTPGMLVTILGLTYRYLFVLCEEASRLRRAQLARTFTADRASVWRGLGTLLGQLFIRSTERAERIYNAMCARGWR